MRVPVKYAIVLVISTLTAACGSGENSDNNEQNLTATVTPSPPATTTEPVSPPAQPAIKLDKTVFLGTQAQSTFLTEVTLPEPEAGMAHSVTLGGDAANRFSWSELGLSVSDTGDLGPGTYHFDMQLNADSAPVELALSVVDESRISDAWGLEGELWRPESRLPWFGHSGYQHGDAPLPLQHEATHSVTDYGAIADDGEDDTVAFTRAIEDAAGGVIYIPEGQYRIEKPITISSPNTVIRGAGRGKTTLFFPQNLEQAMNAPAGTYTYRGGFLQFSGARKHQHSFILAQTATRGSYELLLQDTSEIEAGDYLVIKQRGSIELAAHLHGDHPEVDPEADNQNAAVLTDWVAKVVSINGNRVTMDRPTRHDIKPEWVSVFAHWQDAFQEVGIESMSLKMANEDYAGHNVERGNNAIEIRNAANSWIYDVEILDADNAIKLVNCRFMTLKEIYLGAEYRSTTISGHHGIWFVSNSQENLAENIKVLTQYTHDLSVESRSNGNVFQHSSFIAMNQDHHMWAPYENLFTDMELGSASRLWASGGAASKPRGPHAAARSTSWNLRATAGSAPPLPASNSWPQHNVIAVPAYPAAGNADISTTGTWVEPVNDIYPPNLYEAQRAYKLLNSATF